MTFFPKNFSLDIDRYVGKKFSIQSPDGNGSFNWEMKRNGDLKIEQELPGMNQMAQKLVEDFGEGFKSVGIPDKCGACGHCISVAIQGAKAGTIVCSHPRSTDGEGRVLAVDPELHPVINSLHCPLLSEASARLRTYHDLGAKPGSRARKRGQERFNGRGVIAGKRG